MGDLRIVELGMDLVSFSEIYGIWWSLVILESVDVENA